MEPDFVIPSTGCSPYEFGASIAAWGEELLVGAPFRDYGLRVEEGIPPPTVCLFERSAGQWTLAQTLTASDPPLCEGFARAVALGASFVVIGAPGHENGDGPVHDFTRAGGGPFQLRAALDSPERVAPNDLDVFAEYGLAIATDERLVFVGAPLESEYRNHRASCEGCGAVYVFDRASSSPAPVATLRANRPNENFGVALAVSGDLLVVGASGAYSGRGFAGAVYVFRHEGPDRWREVCRVEGRYPEELFGEQVAIDGSRFAVAAPGRADLGLPVGGGRVELFELRGDVCKPLATLQEVPGFGAALALRGDRLAIGQPTFSTREVPKQTGRVGLYRMSPSGAASREAWLTVAGARDHARVGAAVALGPDYVAAGAPGLGQGDGTGLVAIKSW